MTTPPPLTIVNYLADNFDVSKSKLQWLSFELFNLVYLGIRIIIGHYIGQLYGVCGLEDMEFIVAYRRYSNLNILLISYNKY